MSIDLNSNSKEIYDQQIKHTQWIQAVDTELISNLKTL